MRWCVVAFKKCVCDTHMHVHTCACMYVYIYLFMYVARLPSNPHTVTMSKEAVLTVWKPTQFTCNLTYGRSQGNDHTQWIDKTYNVYTF